MRVLLRVLLVLFTCVVLSGLMEISESKGLKTFSEEDMGISDGILAGSLQRIPQSGDMVCCEDGTSYKITDVSRYVQTPADPSAPEPLPEALLLNSLEDDAIHFSDISGDYLFVKNRYEIIRMLYALSEPAEASGICLQFSIPENAVPIVQESWDPEQVIQSWNARHAKTCCLEAWDLYKDGAYRRTVYLTAAI